MPAKLAKLCAYEKRFIASPSTILSCGVSRLASHKHAEPGEATRMNLLSSGLAQSTDWHVGICLLLKSDRQPFDIVLACIKVPYILVGLVRSVL